MGIELVTLNIFSTRLEAELAKSRLESFGIKALVSADDAGGMRPAPFAYVSGVELIVRESDVEKAKEILSGTNDVV